MAITTRNSSQPKKIKVATRLNPSVISSWQYKNQSALDIINSYNDRISKNEYLSADDIKAYRTAIDDYKSTGDSLIGLTFSGPGDSVEKRNWENHLIQLNRNYNSANNYYSRFADATQYKYATIPFAEDFDENSQYVSTYVGGEKISPWTGMYSNTGYTDIDYDVINRQDKAIGINRVNNLQSGAALAGVDNSERYQMTDDEIKTFNYIYKTEGKDAAYAYIDYIESDLTARQRASDAAEWKAYAAEKPGAASVFSVLTSPLKAVSYVGQTADYLSDGKIDQNAGYNKFSNINTAIRNEVNDVVTKKWGGVGSFAYNTGMSMADFLFTTALGGGSSAVSLGIMGTSAAADTVISSKDRGLNDNQAFILGAVAGGAEILTEKLSIDALLDLTKLGKNAAGYVIKNILSEGGEEVASSLVNLLADVVVAKDQSAWRQSINAYKANGDNDSQAFWHTARDTAVSLGLDFLGGAVSGGVMGGAAVGLNALGTTIQGTKIQQNVGKNAGADITRATLDLAPENAYALKMQGKIDKGKNLSAYQTGKISGEFNTELENLIANETKVTAEENAIDQRKSTTTPNTANAETSITEAPVKRNNMLTEEETAKASKLIERAAQDKIGKIEGFTEETANAMVKGYDGSVTASEYITTFDKAMELGKRGAQAQEVTRLSENTGIGSALLVAYDAGLQARENVASNATNPENSVLQNGTESAIINTESEINSNEGQTTADSLYLRDSGERLGGTNPEGQIPRVEGRTGQNQEWREGRSRPADGEAARILDEGRGREVTVAQLGILHGSKNQKVRVIDNEADFTPSMKKAYADAKKQGLNVKFFVGDNLLIEEANGSISNVRGYILGNTVLVRADHQYYTSDQLVRHEAGHYMIAKGQVDVKKVRNRLKDTVGEKNYNEAARAYTEAYGRTGLDADAVWEELICDSLGDMNIFAQDEAQRELFDLFIPDVQKAVSETKTEAKATEGETKAPTQTRGSPVSTALYKSRDAKGGWGKVYGTAQEALNDAIKSVDSKLWEAFEIEVDSGKSFTPISNAIIAVQQDVRQDTITPIQGAKLLSEVYQKGGAKALDRLYSHETGNLYPKALERAKQYSTSAGEVTEGKASRQISPQSNKTNLSKGESVNEQETQDSGLLVHGRKTSAVGGSKNSQRKQGDDTATPSAQMESYGIVSRGYAGKSGHNGKVTSWIARNRFVSQASVDGFRETLLRNRAGLNRTDVNGRIVPSDILKKFKNSIFTDAEGRLLTLYHWTPNSFKVFARGDIGFHFGIYEAAIDRREGKTEEKRGSDIVKEVYLNIKKPLLLDDSGGEWDAFEIADQLWERGVITLEHKAKINRMSGAQYGGYDAPANIYVRELLEKIGYDGIIYENAVEGKKSLSAIAFYPDQIYTVSEETIGKGKASRELDSLGNELSPAVQKRFANSKVVDEDGRLKVVYHGTPAGEFFTFDKSKGSVEGDFGSGFYFTDNEADVSANYEGGGPDFDNKVWRRAEQIWDEDPDIQMDEAREKARAEMFKGSHKFEVYLNVENPAIVGETILFDPESYSENYNEEDYDSYDDYIGDVEQLLADDVDSIIWDIERNIDLYSNTDQIRNVLYDAYYEGGIDVQKLKDKINELYLESNDGEMVANEVARQIIESLGYDGIIDSTVSSKFKNMGMEEGTTHYIVFKPNQIKSITNQNPTDNPDIRYSRELDLIDYINEKANVEHENMTKAQQLSKIRAELESMKVGKAELMAVQKVADALYGQYGGDASVTEFRYAMLEATKLALEKDGFDAAYEVISEMAKEVAYNPKNITGAAQVLAGIKREIRGTKLAVHETDKTSGEFDRYGGYGEFRKRLFGKINLANEGVDVDSKYMELQNLYGEEFFPEVNTVSEQLMQLEHVMNTPLTDYMTESEAEINDKADDLAQETFSHLGKVWSRAMQDVDVAKRTIKLGSPRATLANALTSAAQSPIEQKKLKEYQQNVDSLNELEKRLFDVRTKINDIKYRKSLIYDGKRLSVREFEQMAYDISESRGVPARNVTFTTLKGEGNTGRYNAYVYTEQVLSAEKSFRSGEEINELKKLEEEARIIETRLHDFDSKLLSLEASQPLRDIITRERTEAYNAAAEKGREALHRNVEGRNKTARKQQILSIAKDLDKQMNRGTKERNVKEGERDLVGLALDLSDMLFVSDDDLIMRGFATTLTPSEETAANHFRELYDLYHSYDNAVTENKDRRAELRAEMNDLKKQLSTVLERERIKISNTKSDAIFKALISKYEVLQKSDDDYIAQSFDSEALEHLKNLRESVGNTTYANMSLSQLEKIYEAFTIVQTMVRNTNKLFKAKKGETAAQSGEKVLNEVKAHGHKERFTEVGELASTYSFNNLKPIYLMERIGSEELSERFQNVIEAESVYATDMKDAKTYALEQKKKYNVRKWNLAAKKSYKTTTGQEFELDLGQRLTLYAYYKRGDQAINHLSSTGFVFDNITPIKDEKGKLSYTLNDKTAYKVSGPVFIEILNSLTKEQKAYADTMIRYLSDTMGSKGNKVSIEMYGINLFTEENYFPIRSDKAYLERAREQANGDVKIKNKGFTKETQKGANNPIVLSDFNSIWSTHVDEMSAYHAFTLPLEDFYKVYNYQNKITEDTAKESVIGAITNAYGSAATNAIDQLLKDINGGTRSDPRETFGKKMLTMFKKAKTMLSLSVVIQQPSSIIRAQSMIDPKYFLKKKISNEKRAELWQEMQKYAPVTIIKDMGHFDVGLGPSSSDWLMTEEYSGFPEKAKSFIKDSAYRDDVLSRPASLADELTWCKIWNAVKLETASKNPKMNTNSKEFLKIAGKRFEDIVRRTQVYDSTLSRSGNMRSKSLYMQMATAFLAEPTTSINMLEMAIRSKDKKRIGRTMAAVYGAALLNSILVALPYAMRDDDEDETFAEKYVSALTTSLIDNVNPITSLPFLKDVWSLFQGYDVKRTDMSAADDIINSLKNIITKAQGAAPDEVIKAILGLIGDLSAFTSIPVDNVIRDVYSVINAGKTITRDIDGMDTTWNSLSDALQKELRNDTPIWAWLKSESKGKKLYDAIIAGDEKYVARFRSEYEDKYADVKNEAEREKRIQNAYNSALRKALRENDPRIREAAEAAYNNKPEEFNKLYKEIVGDGIFTEDIIYGALKAELEAIIRENEE